MSTVLSEQAAGHSESSQVTQAIFMRDMDEPRNLALVAQEDEDAESDSFYDIFDENVDGGWTNITPCGEVPKEDHVKKAKQAYEATYAARIQDISGKLQEKAKEVAEQAAEVSEGYAAVGLGYLAEKLGYYVANETTQNLIDGMWIRSPFLVGLKAAFSKGHNDAVRDRASRDQRIWQTNGGGVAVGRTERQASVDADLAKDEQGDGAMEDVPLGDGDHDEEDSEWNQLQ